MCCLPAARRFLSQGDAFVAELRTRFGDRIVEDNIWADWQAINQYHLLGHAWTDVMMSMAADRTSESDSDSEDSGTDDERSSVE